MVGNWLAGRHGTGGVPGISISGLAGSRRDIWPGLGI